MAIVKDGKQDCRGARRLATYRQQVCNNIYSAMRGGVVFVSIPFFQCLQSSCLTFFYSCKEPEYVMFRFGSMKGSCSGDTRFWKKYYPKGGDFFSNLPDLVKPLRIRSYLCSEETDMNYRLLAWNQSWKLWECYWKMVPKVRQSQTVLQEATPEYMVC